MWISNASNFNPTTSNNSTFNTGSSSYNLNLSNLFGTPSLNLGSGSAGGGGGGWLFSSPYDNASQSLSSEVSPTNKSEASPVTSGSLGLGIAGGTGSGGQVDTAVSRGDENLGKILSGESGTNSYILLFGLLGFLGVIIFAMRKKSKKKG